MNNKERQRECVSCACVRCLFVSSLQWIANRIEKKTFMGTMDRIKIYQIFCIFAGYVYLNLFFHIFRQINMVHY